MKIIFGIFVLTFLAAGTCVAQTNEAIWQQGEGATVRLCVRDKYGVLGGYSATFVVTDYTFSNVKGFKSAQTQTIIRVAADDLGCVSFPKDFSRVSGAPDDIYPVGKYKWSCMVNGKTVAGGSFEFNFELPGTNKRKRRRSKQ